MRKTYVKANLNKKIPIIEKNLKEVKKIKDKCHDTIIH